MSGKLTGAQRRIYLGCFVAYAGAYIGRLNLSAALPGILSGLGISGEQGGILQTVFALVYAAGQLVNGAIVDKISARRFILIGLMGSAFSNLLFGLSSSYELLVVAWCLNGLTQSMLWTPIVKLMARWFFGDQRKQVSFTMSMTIVLGHLIAWAVAGYMAELFDWRLSFIIPACVVALVGVVSWVLLRDEPEKADHTLPAEPDSVSREARMPVGKMLFGSGLWIILLCCIGNGFVRDGVMTWGPTIISSGQNSGLSSVSVSLIIPVINLLGILFGRYCYRWFGSNTRFATGCMTAIGAGISAVLWAAGLENMLICALLMGILCAVMYGINPLLTTLLPMEYDHAGRVGLVAGLVDCCIYLGSSLAGVATGAIFESCGWTVIFLIWTIVSLIGTVCGITSMRVARRNA